MIEITLTTAVLLYGALILSGFLLLYMVSELRARHVYRVLEKQFMWRCAFCGFLYLDENAAVISKCPRCESFNTMEDALDKAVSKARQVVVDSGAERVQEEPGVVPRRNSARRKRPGQTRRGPRRRR